MKYYIVSEEELGFGLRNLIISAAQDMYEVAHDFLKSKQPVDDIEKENIELKSKLENIRYLDRDSVERIIYSGRGNKKALSLAEKVDKICQLAIKEEDIIDVLEKYGIYTIIKNTFDERGKRVKELITPNQIAKEILNKINQ